MAEEQSFQMACGDTGHFCQAALVERLLHVTPHRVEAACQGRMMHAKPLRERQIGCCGLGWQMSQILRDRIGQAFALRFCDDLQSQGQCRGRSRCRANPPIVAGFAAARSEFLSESAYRGDAKGLLERRSQARRHEGASVAEQACAGQQPCAGVDPHQGTAETDVAAEPV